MHQGSALNTLLLVIVMEAISRKFRDAWTWELLYAYNLVLIAENEDDLIKKVNEWKDNVENRGMRANINKTKVEKWHMSEANAEVCKMATQCLW